MRLKANLLLLILLVLLTAGCVTKEPVFLEAPRQIDTPPMPSDHRPRSSPTRFNDSSFVVIPEDTNSYTIIPFSWNYTNGVDHFRLHYGKASRAYTDFIDLGVTNGYVFCKTNWVEEGQRHWFAVTAFIVGIESEYSNEAFYPPYPPSHYRISWTNPAPITIVAHTNITVPTQSWPIVTQTPSGITNFSALQPTDKLFFIGYHSGGLPDVLTISVFNPLNNP